MESIYRKPKPKFNILYTDMNGKFCYKLVYSDEELDEFIEKVDSEGGKIMRVYDQ